MGSNFSTKPLLRAAGGGCLDDSGGCDGQSCGEDAAGDVDGVCGGGDGGGGHVAAAARR